LKKIGLLLPIAGGSRAAAQDLNLALTGLGHTLVLGDFERLCRQAGAILKNPTPEMIMDLAGQLITVRLIAEKTEAVIIPALTPYTRYFLLVLKNAGIKTLYWAVEDHRLVTEWAQVADACHAVACIQPGEFEQKLKNLGCRNVRYLPHGTARRHNPANREKIYPVVFVGAPYPNRVQFYQQLRHQGIPLKIWGDEWKPYITDPDLGPALMTTDRWMAPEEIFSIYQQARLVLNLHSAGTGEPAVKLDGDFLNPRLFDAAASGTLQLTDRRPLVAGAFTEGREVECFATLEECGRKINHYLAHPAEADAIGRAGAERCMREHTLEQRAGQMLQLLDS
jgi:spore maturation protein CgeB